jgi:ascorbate-specific PTS system EIIC-type component UlaA
MNYNPYSPPESTHLSPAKQALRTRELKSARIILIVVGVIQLLFGAYSLFNLRAEFDKAVAAEVKTQGPGYVVDPELADAAFEEQKGTLYAANSVPLALGLVFIILSLFVYRHPVGVTLTGLILFILAHLGDAIVDPSSLLKGIILKVVFISILWKAYQSARSAKAIEIG